LLDSAGKFSQVHTAKMKDFSELAAESFRIAPSVTIG
jgi:hypothetical protein